MKRTTTNKLSMYHSVTSVMSEFQSVWLGVPAIVSSVNNFNSKLDLLNIRLAEQSSATAGVTVGKNVVISDLRDRLLIVQHALVLYGESIGDTELQARNRYSKTVIAKWTIARLAIRCIEVKTDLDAFGGFLADYGITGVEISEILPMLSGIHEVSYRTRSAILKRKGITESINDLEHELDDILRSKLDGLMLLFKKNRPAFFNAFTNARVIVNNGAGHGITTPPEPDDGDVV